MPFASSAFPNIYGAFLYIWGQQGFIIFVCVFLCLGWGWDLKLRLLWDLGFFRKISLLIVTNTTIVERLPFTIIQITTFKNYLFNYVFFFSELRIQSITIFLVWFWGKNRATCNKHFTFFPIPPPKFVRIWSIVSMWLTPAWYYYCTRCTRVVFTFISWSYTKQTGNKLRKLWNGNPMWDKLQLTVSHLFLLKK